MSNNCLSCLCCIKLNIAFFATCVEETIFYPVISSINDGDQINLNSVSILLTPSNLSSIWGLLEQTFLHGAWLMPKVKFLCMWQIMRQ